MEAFQKSHDAIDVTIRNQQPSIHNIKTRLGKLTKFVNKRLPPKISDQKTQPHVLVISTEEDTIFEFLEAKDEDIKQPELMPNRIRIEEKKIVLVPSSHDVRNNITHRGVILIKKLHLLLNHINLHCLFLLDLEYIHWNKNIRSL